eukprot:10708017-Alexandrium_andersonii.AAC.1
MAMSGSGIRGSRIQNGVPKKTSSVHRNGRANAARAIGSHLGALRVVLCGRMLAMPAAVRAGSARSTACLQGMAKLPTQSCGRDVWCGRAFRFSC